MEVISTKSNPILDKVIEEYKVDRIKMLGLILIMEITDKVFSKENENESSSLQKKI